MITPSTNSVVTARYAGAMYNLALDYSTTQQILASTATPGAMTDLENQLFIRDFSNMATSDVATIVATNLGLTGDALDAAVVFLTGWITGTVFTERGAVIAQIVNNFSLMTEDPTFGTFATAWNVKVANAVAYAQNPSSTGTIDFDDVPTSNPGSFTLTNGTDIATANIFTAGLVYTPGGDDRINALQDEDQLTGTGTAPTLNATLGNANDNGANIITPKLTGIEVINTAFTGSGEHAVTALDLQDATGQTAVNITRISQAVNQAEVGNIMTPASSLSLANTNANQSGVVEFSYGPNVLRGDNTGTIAISNVQVGTLNIGQNAIIDTTLTAIAQRGVNTNGFEHLTLNSAGVANTIGTLRIPMDTGTSGNLTITGDQALTLADRQNILQAVGSTLVDGNLYDGGVTGNEGRLATIDASGLTASLTLNIPFGQLTTGKANTSGVPQNVTIKGTGFDDTFYLNDTVQTNLDLATGDKIEGGEGNDTLVVFTGGVGTVKLSGSIYTVVNGPELVTGVEKVDVQAVNDVLIDFARIPNANLVNLRNIDNSLIGNSRVAKDNGDWTVALANLTAEQGDALNIQHSTTENNSIVDTTVVALLKDSSHLTTDTVKDRVGISINEGFNSDPRFNFTLRTNADNPSTAIVERVEFLTITETDSESNSVELGSAADYIGTITLAGGVLPDPLTGGGLPGSVPSNNRFLNLDVNTASIDTERNGLKQVDVSGGADDNLGNPAIGGENKGWTDVGALATQVRLVAGVIDASADNSDVILRVSTTAANTDGGQKITMGAGNDTVIFDDISPSSATYRNAGLTNADTVSGGAGNNVLAIDGHGVFIVLQQSEWDNVSDFQSIYLVGNGSGNLVDQQYFLQLDNDMITKNGTNGNLITIGNDDGSVVSTIDDTDLRVATEGNNAVRLDATTLSADKHFAYDGEEGLGSTADRFVVNDQNSNGGNIIDGGDVSIKVGVDSLGVTRQLLGIRSSDVLEIRNTATITTADLSNVKNVGNLVINNDLAVAQTLNLTLNSAVVDALSDSGHTATIAERETLTIRANDRKMTDAAGSSIASSSVSLLNINARDVSGAFELTIIGDDQHSGGDLVNLSVNLGGGPNSLNLGVGTDVVNFYADVNVTRVQTTANGLKFLSLSGLASQDVNIVDGDNTINYFDKTTNAVLTPDATGVLVLAGGGGGGGDTTPPTLLSSNPADNATGVAVGANVALTFSENVVAGAGNVSIFTTVGDTLVTAIPAGDPQVSIAGGVVTVNPVADLAAGSGFYVRVDANAFRDAAGNFFAGIANSTALNFTTASAGGGGVPLPVGTTAEVVATAAAEMFTFDVAGARAIAANTQIPLAGFAVANDSLQIDLVTANPAITNLSQLNGVDGIAVESNVILNNTLINFGNDTNGDVISVTLAGIVDPATVSVTVI